MDRIIEYIKMYGLWIQWSEFKITDFIEMFFIAFAIYQFIIWIKKTRAWTLLKGLIMLLAVCLLAVVFRMNVILWIFEKCIGVGITAIVVIFQPELRKALEQLGRNQWFKSIFGFDDVKNRNEKLSNKTINEIVRATYELAKTKTGALMVISNMESLIEYERTGIVLDAAVSSQLLINIFEHNTPLHDGAIVINEDRITAATCYLPLSDNMELSKDLGTRHRAGVGISEVTDSLTIIVSEETGKVSIAVRGTLIRNVDGEYLKNKLRTFTGQVVMEKRKLRILGMRQK
ncbi:MAG: diadenylate cyclase CdaA [Lachnospiraceae bacterium]|nr:diadenylate cyclase CdaA [Lachnospiraceae bacterium]